MADGMVDRVYAIYVIRNSDVGSERHQATEIGEPTPDPRAVLKNFSVVLKGVKGCKAEHEASAEFATSQMERLKSLKKGDRIKVSGTIDYSHVDQYNVTIQLENCEILP